MELELTRRRFLGGASALLASAPAASYAAAAGAGKPALKLGILSDIHISPAAYMKKYLLGDPSYHRPRETDLFEKALEYFDLRGADAVVLAGDLADWGLVGQMKAVTDCWWRIFPDGRSRRDGRHVELLAVLGNHDTAFRAWTVHKNYAIPAMGNAKVPPEDLFRNDIPRHWEELFREPYAPIWKKTVKGFTFIGAHWREEPGIPAFMEKHGPALRGMKPFFVIQHPHPKGTCFSNNPYGDHDFGGTKLALSPYPNAVAISGHSHFSLTNERSVWQEEFTSIGAASLDSLTLDRGRENGPRVLGNRRYGLQPIVHGRIVGGTDVTYAAHGLFMSVYDGFLEVERREFVHGRSVGPNWVIPMPAGRESPFSYKTREAAALQPGPFPEDAKIKVTREQKKIRLEFPPARNVVGAPRALDYEVEATVEEADVKRILFRRYVYSEDAFLAPEDVHRPVAVLFRADLFPKEVDVKFAVRAHDVFGGFNAPLHGTLGRVYSRANRYGKWVAYDTETVDSIVGLPPDSDPATDEYGGWKVKAGDAAGFFRVKKTDGRWWLVDPLGNRYISKGVAVFVPGGSSRQKEALKERFGTKERWAASELGFLKEYGFNSLGAWSAVDVLAGGKIPERMPYTVIINAMSTYLKKHPVAEGAQVMLDAAFDEHLEKVMSVAAKYANDPYLIGYFVDNELPWGSKALEDRFEPYLEKVRRTLKKYDPNHLYLGCRFNKWRFELGSEKMFRIAGKYMDVISVNHYNHWQPDVETFRKWERWSGRPIMVTEFYAKGEDSGLMNATGGGWLVRFQEDRGLFYENFVNELVKSGVCVGWHWFKYMDNDPTDLTTDPSNRNSNKGVVTWDFMRYMPLLNHMKAMNGRICGLIDFYDRMARKTEKKGSRT